MKPPILYQITVTGHLDDSWADWFGAMQIEPCSLPDGAQATRISGMVCDQPALFGLLIKIRDLNLTLISLEARDAGGDQVARNDPGK